MDLAAYIELLAGLPAKQWPRESFVASNILEVRDLEPLIRNITGTPSYASVILAHYSRA